MNEAASYLVVAAQGLGDSLEATTLIRSIRAHDPEAAIDVAITRAGPRDLFLGLPSFVRNVHYLPYWDHGPLAFTRELLAARSRRKYDASFLAYPSARWVYDVLLRAYPSRRRFAHDIGGRTVLRLPASSATLVPVRPVHNVERNRDLLRAAGIPPDNDFGYLVPENWFDTDPRVGRQVAIHVGSVNHDGLAAKRWPLESYRELCSALLDLGYKVTLIVGPDERDDCALLAKSEPRVDRFEGDLSYTARFVSRCALLIANDNGIAHVAAGVGTPVIALFGPTPLEFAPFVRSSLSLRPSACPPCFDVRRPIVECVRDIDFACLKRDLSPAFVLAAAKNALAAGASIEATPWRTL